MAAITICSDFGAPKNKVCHCFHCFPIYFPWSDGAGCHDLRFWMLRREGQPTPKERPQPILAPSFYMLCLPLPEHALRKVGLARRAVVFHLRVSLFRCEVGFSFVPFSRAFPFLCLLATAILDSFFLFYLTKQSRLSWIGRRCGKPTRMKNYRKDTAVYTSVESH